MELQDIQKLCDLTRRFETHLEDKFEAEEKLVFGEGLDGLDDNSKLYNLFGEFRQLVIDELNGNK